MPQIHRLNVPESFSSNRKSRIIVLLLSSFFSAERNSFDIFPVDNGFMVPVMNGLLNYSREYYNIFSPLFFIHI